MLAWLNFVFCIPLSDHSWYLLMHSFGVDLTVAGVTGIPKHDDEGRVITAEYEDFYMVNACKITFKWQIVFGFVIRPLLMFLNLFLNT